LLFPEKGLEGSNAEESIAREMISISSVHGIQREDFIAHLAPMLTILCFQVSSLSSLGNINQFSGKFNTWQNQFLA
jgi:hypothetical protein